METLQQQQLQLKCFRCGHDWLRRTVNSLPKQCPLCHSSIWNENLFGTAEAKAHIKEKTRALSPAMPAEEFERLFDTTYANVLAAYMSERNFLACAIKDCKKAAKGPKRGKK